MITGSHDCQIKLWDLIAGKAMTTLTHHKKAVRALKMHTKEFSFVSAAADNMKKWQVRGYGTALPHQSVARRDSLWRGYFMAWIRDTSCIGIRPAL